MTDYFAQFTEGTEAVNLFDMAVASIALPYTYKKTVDTFAEPQKSKPEKNKFMELAPKVPVNMTKELPEDWLNLIGRKFP